LKGDQDVEYIL